ncbi:MAG TPA: hypothetical protein PL033_06190 [Candidatus Brocadiia bacterium]|nr:hypothetical protein [Candidatus Brocadiia bacterium]
MNDSRHEIGAVALALKDLAALYREADARVAALGLECAACGRCCDFRRRDHVLYATELEVIFLGEIKAVPCGASPGNPPCPFQDAGRCSARERRPLGCRVYFCKAGPDWNDSVEELHRKLRDIHDRHRLPYSYAPFLAHPLIVSLDVKRGCLS